MAQPRSGRTARGPHWFARGRTWATGHWQRIQEHRLHSRWLDAGFGVVERDEAAVGGLVAGALAFRLFLWLLPCALLVFSGLGFADKQAADAVSAGGVRAFTASSIQQAADQAQRSRWWALVVGVVLLFLASRHLLRALVAASNLAWKNTAPRQRVTARGTATLMVFGIAAAALASLSGHLRRHGPIISLGALVGLVLVWVLLWWVASSLLPHQDAPLIYLLPGAVVFGIGVQLLYAATVVYFSPRIESASDLYGGLGGAATMLLWLYVLARLTVLAMVVNAVVFERRVLAPLEHLDPRRLVRRRRAALDGRGHEPR